MEGERDARGRWLPGAQGNVGRPKGARSKLNAKFFDDYYVAWQDYGQEALRQMAMNNPKDFVKVAAMVCPKEVDIEVAGQVELLARVENFSQAYHFALEHIGAKAPLLVKAEDASTE